MRVECKVGVAVLVCLLATGAVAQNSPGPSTGPDPTNPVPPNPLGKPGADIVINPSMDECRRGWNASMRWTKDQFDNFCIRLGTSK